MNELLLIISNRKRKDILFDFGLIFGNVLYLLTKDKFFKKDYKKTFYSFGFKISDPFIILYYNTKILIIF